jgi:hypothetical protein
MDGFSVIVVGQAGVTTGALVTHEDPLLAKLAFLLYVAVDPSSDTLYIVGSYLHCAGCEVHHFLRRAHFHQRKQ